MELFQRIGMKTWTHGGKITNLIARNSYDLEIPEQEKILEAH